MLPAPPHARQRLELLLTLAVVVGQGLIHAPLLVSVIIAGCCLLSVGCIPALGETSTADLRSAGQTANSPSRIAS